MKLHVSDRVHNVVWLGVFLLHAGCFVFLFSSALVLLFLCDPAVAYWISYVENPSSDHFYAYAVALGAVGACYGVSILQLLFLSARSRTLALNTFTSQLHKPTIGHAPPSVSDRVIWRYYVRLLGRTLNALANGFNRVFGLSSPYFNEVLMVREFIEIAAQTYQAYRFSALIARSGINHAFIALVILNCWSTPLIQTFIPPGQTRNLLQARLVCVVVNIVLNMLTSMCLPMMLFMPYYFAFDPVWLTFSLEHFYDPVWFISFVTESQFVFPVSTSDFLNKLVPHIGILVSLVVISLRVVRDASITNQGAAVVPSAPTAQAVAIKSQPQPLVAVEVKGSRAAIRTSRSRLFSAGNSVMAIAGLGLLALHVRAKILVDSREQTGCLHKVYPWLPNKFPCMAFSYNCYRHDDGTMQSYQLEELDPDLLLYLTISHCDQLVVPPQVQQLDALIGFAVYNSTVIDWGIEAAFSTTRQRNLRALIFFLVNFTTFPPALLQPLPSSISDIEFSHTNLTTIPSDLHEYWYDVGVLYLEFCEINEFSETFTKMPVLYDFSLFGNNISDIYLFANMSSTLTFVSLDENPVRSLPDALNEPHAFLILTLENMELTTIPDWVRTDVTGEALLYGNPYCESNPEDESVVKCITRDGRGNGKTPYDYVSELTPL